VLALPFVLAVCAGALAVARSVRGTAPLGRLLAVVLAGAGAAVAAAATGRVGEEILAIDHGGTGSTLVGGFVADALVALPATMLAAALVALCVPALLRTRPARLAGASRIALTGSIALVLVIPGAALVRPATGDASASGGTGPCPVDAPLRTYAVTAIDVDIPLNRHGDHDPAGKMYVLTDQIAAVRAQEQSRKVSIGLRDDAIQPLVIRANMGDCVEIAFANAATGGDFGLHIDGLGFTVESSGDLVGKNVSSQAAPGASRVYRYLVPSDAAAEGARHIHPGPGNRDAMSHGLFGSLVVEPPGSEYLSPEDSATPIASGWEAVIKPAGRPAFREGVKIYHEIGNEDTPIFDRNGIELPLLDPHTGAYRPASRALNYRSEPFMRRLDQYANGESQAYGSYSFGDPPTPMPRGYLGDPTKFRVMHAGSEMLHVHHMHGGGIRWRMNPQADTTSNYANTGLNKHPGTVASPSARLDSQAIAPGESFNLEIEGGAGGAQQAVGDFLFHCHIGHHYVAGMWGFWRVFDTLQPDLAPLPDRTPLNDAVDSTELVGKTFGGTTITAANLDAWIRPQLPPQGVPLSSEDATVLDWTTAAGNPTLYLGEPEDTNTTWPNLPNIVPGHPSALPGDTFVGNRPRLLFNPTNGRPAYPLLRTHVGKRPPFAPRQHGGAPWLGEHADDAAPGDPYSGRKDAICPTGSPTRRFNVVAIERPIRATDTGLVDPGGKIFTLAKDKAAKLNPANDVEPLAIRANVGDCVAVTFVNEQSDAGSSSNFSKVNMHIHHVQFDVQASDGVVSGMAFEQTVRPYRDPQDGGAQLPAGVAAGATQLPLSDVTKLRPGVAVAIGMGEESIEVRTVTAVGVGSVTLDKPLSNAHAAGQWAGTEFAQYRWYPDVLLDNVFWHDHVDGLHTWSQGLVGQLIVEPKGSTYHDPTTGDEVDSGTIVDVRTSNPLAKGLVEGSFRELVLWQINGHGSGVDSTLNLKAEPFSTRLGDAANRFSSWTHGDPFTPLPRAYTGDPVAIRAINADAADGLWIDGHRTFLEPRYAEGGAVTASRVDAIVAGVSERFTLILEGGAGGTAKRSGDYIYGTSTARRFRQGAWGLLRVLPSETPDLKPLPGTSVPAGPPALGSVTGQAPPPTTDMGDACPTNAPQRTFAVAAVDVSGQAGLNGVRAAFVPASQADAIINHGAPSAPLVLHAAAGECVVVTFTNRRGVRRASFHMGKLKGAAGTLGVNAGFNTEQTVAPGETRTYRFFVDNARLGTATISDFGGDDSAVEGLYGALVVAPKGAVFTDPATGVARDVGPSVDVTAPGVPAYRDFTLIFADDDPKIGGSTMPYPVAVSQEALINYRSATGRVPNPLVSPADQFSSAVHGDPPLVLKAHVGDPVRVHALVAPGSEQTHAIHLGGLSFPLDPQVEHSELITSRSASPRVSVDAHVVGGAGGCGKFVGDIFVGDARRPFTDAGMWGLMRVLPESSSAIMPLAASPAPKPCPTRVAAPLPDDHPSGETPGDTSLVPLGTRGTTSTGIRKAKVGITLAKKVRVRVARRVGIRVTVTSQAYVGRATLTLGKTVVTRIGTKSVKKAKFFSRKVLNLRDGSIAVALRNARLTPGSYRVTLTSGAGVVSKTIRVVK
jgi:FtsP/CotA-like multicopper oxidase with cupredoxin domain